MEELFLVRTMNKFELIIVVCWFYLEKEFSTVVTDYYVFVQVFALISNLSCQITLLQSMYSILYLYH